MDPNLIQSIVQKIAGRSLFLIGMMGCGKSQTGPVLAKSLNYKYIDLDDLIEKVAQKPINKIFVEDGEKNFRTFESKCLQEIIKIPSMVISTGGGVVTEKENWGVLSQGIVIWMNLKKEFAIDRLSKEISKRPMLKGKELSEIYDDIFNSRKDLYAQADLSVNIADESVEEVVIKIINGINKKLLN